jgi:hypothetical protein
MTNVAGLLDFSLGSVPRTRSLADQRLGVFGGSVGIVC